MSEARDLYLQRLLVVGGPETAKSWTQAEREAWAGFLALTTRLTRVLTPELHEAHGLSVSMLGMLGRLEAAEHRALRLTHLAATMDLSLGRVSRIVDILEKRGLVERKPCPEDARAINAVLTDEGVIAARKAQQTVRDAVRRHVLDPLSDDEAALLATVFERLLTRLEHTDPDAGGTSE